MTDAGPLVVPSPDPAATRPAGYLGSWPPVCNGCGHRHLPGGACADHAWRDDCPYTAGPDCPALVEVTDTDGAPMLSSPGVVYVAVCVTCVGSSALPPQPFGAQDTRDEWAMRHADEHGHSVALAVQTEQGGTVVTGRATPDDEPPAEQPADRANPFGLPAEFVESIVTGTVRRGGMRFGPPYFSPPGDDDPAVEPAESDGAPVQPRVQPDPAAAPLVAFRVSPGGPPDLMCRIPNRAGAAWLAYAAHACLLGRQGSSGIPEPHRAMLIGKVTAPLGPGTEWRVRIDGMIGAHRDDLGQAVGFVITVPASATLPVVEDLVEQSIAANYRLPAHEFSVLLVTDVGYGEVADPDAAAIIRSARQFGYVPHIVEVPDELAEQVAERFTDPG